MKRVHLDTHVVVWLFERRTEKLLPARARLQGATLVASPMVVLELWYLHEIGRLTTSPDRVMDAVCTDSGLVFSSAPWRQVVDAARFLTWTRDPFDRLITANALADGLPLVTADERIRAHCASAVFA